MNKILKILINRIIDLFYAENGIINYIIKIIINNYIN